MNNSKIEATEKANQVRSKDYVGSCVPQFNGLIAEG